MDPKTIATQIILNNLKNSNCLHYKPKGRRIFEAYVINDYEQAKKLLTELHNSGIEIGIDLSYGVCTRNVRFIFKDPEIIIFQIRGIWDYITFKGMVVMLDTKNIFAPQFYVESAHGIDIFDGAYTQGAYYIEEKDKRYKGLVDNEMKNYIFLPEQVKAEQNEPTLPLRPVIVNAKQEIVAYMNVCYVKEDLLQQLKRLLFFFNENGMDSTDVAKYICQGTIPEKKATENQGTIPERKATGNLRLNL